MDIEAIRRFCLDLPHTSEVVQWGGALVLKVGGKMFAVAALEPGPPRLSLKVSDENFAELCERPNIIPAPYLARAQWVCLERLNAVSDGELRDLLAEAYRLVFERLPKKRQTELQAPPAKRPLAQRSQPAKAARKKSGGKAMSKKIARRSGRGR